MRDEMRQDCIVLVLEIFVFFINLRYEMRWVRLLKIQWLGSNVHTIQYTTNERMIRTRI